MADGAARSIASSYGADESMAGAPSSIASGWYGLDGSMARWSPSCRRSIVIIASMAASDCM
eukprot:CAMPEP_0201865944 /NCGR_PEP_ID=MMETSP0902-20130614/695_1 /ASSEMBLY_ACC=CAM_ASM_000551 /TAXON_ID=420261 /ORGANISM="Thalassiosira antarctica, Strain CCMP982" /LENGTH=60 /DNA_ID=CAMNT_0048390815 /DNA_START=309 /DNA_END=488 /DNA_ORIENTATION=+